MSYEKQEVTPCYGFTLAEVLVCFLLIAILTTGAFKSFHLVQAGANTNLVRFTQLNTQRLSKRLEQLRQRYSNISADSDFGDLACLLQPDPDCE